MSVTGIFGPAVLPEGDSRGKRTVAVMDHVWVILLAAGNGSRVRPLTSDPDGSPVPKQFFAPAGGDSMLRWSVSRAGRHVPRSRTIVVVSENHRQWWTKDLWDVPPGNIVVQPRDRGTAAGILLPLLHVLRRDRHATVLVLPTDHYVHDEAVLRRGIRATVEAAAHLRDRVLLIGMVPEATDTECGWIAPGLESGFGSVRDVRSFVEKPSPEAAEALRRGGALLNSFMFVADGHALLALYARTVPSVLARFGEWQQSGHGSDGSLSRLYEEIPCTDFSRHVLQASPGALAVLPVAGCGWRDLGTPARLRPFLERRSTTAAVVPSPIQTGAGLPAT